MAFLWSHLALGFCLIWKIFVVVGIFLVIVSLSVLCDCFFMFLFLPGSVWEGCIFLNTHPCLLGHPFYWQTVACSSSLLWSFVFLRCQSVVWLTFLILLIWVISLFFWWVSLKVYQFCQELTFSVIDLCFLCLYFICFCSDFCIFFPCTKFGFCLFFFL